VARYQVILFIQRLFEAYELLILARVVLSWLPTIDYTHPVVNLLYRITEPFLRPFRRLMPRGLMLDFSPMIALIVLEFLKQLVISLFL
jgi:YggT family protein